MGNGDRYYHLLLTIHDCSRVRVQWLAPSRILIGNQLKHRGKLGQSFLARRHQCVTARYRWYLSTGNSKSRHNNSKFISLNNQSLAARNSPPTPQPPGLP